MNIARIWMRDKLWVADLTKKEIRNVHNPEEKIEFDKLLGIELNLIIAVVGMTTWVKVAGK